MPVRDWAARTQRAPREGRRVREREVEACMVVARGLGRKKTWGEREEKRR